MKKRLAFGIGSGLVLAAVAGWAAIGVNSGLAVGEAVSAFEPTHVTGPDKGTNTCPVCKYGATSAVQVWVNGDSMANVAKIASTLEKRIDAAGTKNLKSFVLFVAKPGNEGDLSKKLEKVASDNNLKYVALCYVPKSDESVGVYKINTESDVKNTVLVYTHRKVTDKFVNLKADEEGLASLNSAVDKITAK